MQRAVRKLVLKNSKAVECQTDKTLWTQVIQDRATKYTGVPEPVEEEKQVFPNVLQQDVLSDDTDYKEKKHEEEMNQRFEQMTVKGGISLQEPSGAQQDIHVKNADNFRDEMLVTPVAGVSASEAEPSAYTPAAEGRTSPTASALRTPIG